jgi:hypothetical protein
MGLPVMDLSPLSAKCNGSIPGWATLVPKMAHRMARRTVDAQLADQSTLFLVAQDADQALDDAIL